MSVNGFHLPQNHPCPESDDMARNQRRTHEEREAKHEQLCPVGMQSYKCHGRSEFMVHSVDLVIAPFGMEEAMYPVARIVLNQKIDQNLEDNFPTGRQWQTHPDPNPLQISNKLIPTYISDQQASDECLCYPIII